MIHIRGKSRSKYNNKKVELDGIKFDSKKESSRYLALRFMEKANLIQDLKIHPRYDLTVNGQKICAYVADFEYLDLNGSTPRKITEDVKGVKTPAYQLKKKLMLAIHGIKITEV